MQFAFFRKWSESVCESKHYTLFYVEIKRTFGAYLRYTQYLVLHLNFPNNFQAFGQKRAAAAAARYCLRCQSATRSVRSPHSPAPPTRLTTHRGRIKAQIHIISC